MSNYILLFLLVGFYFILLYVIKVQFPNPDELLVLLQTWYGTYGYPLIFLSALLEGTFIISFYVPGSTAVLLGAAISKTGVIQFPLVLLLATAGLMCSYCLNYLLGTYGWYHALHRFGLERGVHMATTKLHEHKKKTFFLGYIHPGSASFISTAAGISNIPFWEFFFYSLLSQSFWSIVWGGLAYIVGMVLVELFIKYFSIVVFILVGIWFLKRAISKRIPLSFQSLFKFRKLKRNKHSQNSNHKRVD